MQARAFSVDVFRGLRRPTTACFGASSFVAQLIGAAVFLCLASAWIAGAPSIAQAAHSPTSGVCILTNKVQGEMGGSIESRFEVPQELGLTMVRALAIHIPLSEAQKSSPQWEIIKKDNFRNVQNFDARKVGQKATDAPTDLKAWSQELEEAIQFSKPTLVVIENEENTPNFYNGTAAQYLAQLKASVEVAHRLGYKISNGGITAAAFVPFMVRLWVSQGHRDMAEAYLHSLGKDYPGFGNPLDKVMAAPAFAHNADKGKELLDGYKATGIDYLNFHWYGSDPAALKETKDFLEHYVGLPSMTNEIGQHDQSPKTVTDIVTAMVDLKFPYACWYDGDGKQAFGLHNTDGSLRPTGEAFKNVISAHK